MYPRVSMGLNLFRSSFLRVIMQKSKINLEKMYFDVKHDSIDLYQVHRLQILSRI